MRLAQLKLASAFGLWRGLENSNYTDNYMAFDRKRDTFIFVGSALITICAFLTWAALTQFSGAELPEVTTEK